MTFELFVTMQQGYYLTCNEITVILLFCSVVQPPDLLQCSIASAIPPVSLLLLMADG